MLLSTQMCLLRVDVEAGLSLDHHVLKVALHFAFTDCVNFDGYDGRWTRNQTATLVRAFVTSRLT